MKPQGSINKTEIWKQASEVYAEISELSAKQALAHIYGIKNITADVREAVITLINAGSQASQYFQDNISGQFNFCINKNFKTGQQLDEYELIKEIGHGGMSQVFIAKRMNSEQQTNVAIKIFAPRESSTELFNHFIREQKILSQLSHPHIVKMLHGGMTDDSTAYLVMELIDQAQTLDSYCHSKKLKSKQIIELISQCADALVYSHANLIIHRDLKPDNILVNKNEELKIVDFGIAKLINNDISGDKTTIMALTPSYAAPEQINSQPISVKTDVFSLAVVALALLVKDAPLPKDRLIKSCSNDEAHIDKTLKSLTIDKDLKNILTKALAQNPDHRYSNMQSLADDLNNWLQNKPVNATSQSIPYRIRKFAKRRSALFATLVSFASFLIIGSILGYQQYKQIKIEAQKAETVKQFMLNAFELTDPDNSQGTDITAKDLLTLASSKLTKNENIDPQVKFELLKTLGISFGKLGHYEKAIDVLKQSLLINPKESESTSYLARYLFNTDQNQELLQLLDKIDLNDYQAKSDILRIYRIKAKILASNSDYQQAISLIDKSKQLNFPEDPIEKALTASIEAQIYYYQSNTTKSIEILTDLIAQSQLQASHTVLLAARSHLASYYDEIGQFEQAIAQWQEIIKVQKKILGNKHPELAISLLQISISYKHIGDYQNAYKMLDEAYDISLNTYGLYSAVTAEILNSRAIYDSVQGKMDEAIEGMERAIDILQQIRSTNQQDLNIFKTNLALFYLQKDRNTEAQQLLNELYVYQSNKLGEAHVSTLYTQQLLARALDSLGRKQEAIELAKMAVQSSQKYLQDKNNNHIIVGGYYTLAKLYHSNNQYLLAIQNYKKIIDQKLLNPKDGNYALMLFSIAKLYTDMGDFDNAQKYFKETIEKHTNIFSASHPKTIKIQIRYAKLLKAHGKNQQYQQLKKIIQATINDHNIEDEDIVQLSAELD
jgi:serine/threonine-protein kinase